jgi:cystathionine gamma-synthase
MSHAPTCHDRRRATRAVRAGIDRDPAFGAVVPPLVLSSNFSFAGFAEKRQYDYTRSGNPTRDLLGEALAELEGGAGGVVTATGMAAITLVLHALLQPGDRLVVPHDCYGGSWRLFNALAKKGHFELITCDLTDPRALAEAWRNRRRWSGSRRRPTRCCASPTCAS